MGETRAEKVMITAPAEIVSIKTLNMRSNLMGIPDLRACLHKAVVFAKLLTILQSTAPPPKLKT